MIRSSVQVRLSASQISLFQKKRPLSSSVRVCFFALYSLSWISLNPRVHARPKPTPIAQKQWYVALDPGHGGKNYGAVDIRVEGRYEKHYTLIMAKEVAQHLKGAGVKVWISRDRDKPVTLKERIRKASAAGVDLFVSIHINDSHVVGPRGHGTFFLSRSVFEESRLRVREFDQQTHGALFESSVKARVRSAQAKEVLFDLIHQRAQHEAVHLAHIVNQALSEVSPHGTRGVKQGNYGIIKGITTPAIVCEVGFMNHPKEGPYVTSREGMSALSLGITRGILRYLVLRRNADLAIPALNPK